MFSYCIGRKSCWCVRTLGCIHRYAQPGCEDCGDEIAGMSSKMSSRIVHGHQRKRGQATPGENRGVDSSRLASLVIAEL